MLASNNMAFWQFSNFQCINEPLSFILVQCPETFLESHDGDCCYQNTQQVARTIIIVTYKDIFCQLVQPLLLPYWQLDISSSCQLRSIVHSISNIIHTLVNFIFFVCFISFISLILPKSSSLLKTDFISESTMTCNSGTSMLHGLYTRD